MYSEQLAIMLFMAVAQLAGPQAKPHAGPVVEDARHAMIRAVKEPELVAALSLRARRVDMHRQQAIASQTMLASAE